MSDCNATLTTCTMNDQTERRNRSRTPEHHHYMGFTCAHRGRTCTDPRCARMVDDGVLKTCAETCSEDQPEGDAR